MEIFKRGLIFIFISSHETAEIVDSVTNIFFGGKRAHDKSYDEPPVNPMRLLEI